VPGAIELDAVCSRPRNCFTLASWMPRSLSSAETFTNPCIAWSALASACVHGLKIILTTQGAKNIGPMIGPMRCAPLRVDPCIIDNPSIAQH